MTEGPLDPAVEVRVWTRRFDAVAEAPKTVAVPVYERGVHLLPRSYKLWRRYLAYRVNHCVDRGDDKGAPRPRLPARDAEWDRVNACFERALGLLATMPVLWETYLQFLTAQPQSASTYRTRTRRAFDRALRALPVTQHGRIWPLFRDFGRAAGGATFVAVWRRYGQWAPASSEEFAGLLLEKGLAVEAACVYASLLSSPWFVGDDGTTAHALWLRLCDALGAVDGDAPEPLRAPLTPPAPLALRPVCKSLGRLTSLDVDALLRRGIAQFPEMAGELWTALAQWKIRRGDLELARNVFWEAIGAVNTQRDFTLVYDALLAFEESCAVVTMEQEDAGAEADRLLGRLESLLEQRPFLVSDVYLRQNANHVVEWEKRALLWLDRGDSVQARSTLQKALETVQPQKAHGPLSRLFLRLAELEGAAGDWDAAAEVLERAVEVPYRTVDELAHVWCRWAELELERGRLDAAVRVATRATAVPGGGDVRKAASVRLDDASLPPQARVFRSLRLWLLLADLHENRGPLAAAAAVYERMAQLKLATPRTILAYAGLLERDRRFEDAFRVYERGIDAFGFPAAYDLWLVYLARFSARYGATRLERTRDLFEQAVDRCPDRNVRSFLLLFAEFEETHGLVRSALRLYERAAERVPAEQRAAVYALYLQRIERHLSFAAARGAYQRAAEVLAQTDARCVCLQFAAREVAAGEIDRARAVLAYGAQFSDPRAFGGYWRLWHQFEVRHGTEVTFREMMRVRHAVQTRFSTSVKAISAHLQQIASTPSSAAPAPAPTAHPMAQAAASALAAHIPGGSVQFVRAAGDSGSASASHAAASHAATSHAANPDEISI